MQISFTGVSHKVYVGDNMGTKASEMKNEIAMTKKAKEAGVQVPNLVHAGEGYSYDVDGDLACGKTNPIKKEHFANLLNDLYLLDKRGIFHNDLDIGHIYYSPNGKVEMDFYRFARPIGLFAKRSETPENPNNPPHAPFVMLSNALNYEMASLAPYNKANPDKDYTTTKEYLQASADYHKKRAAFLAIQREKGLDISDEKIEFERLQQKLLPEPDRDMVLLRMKRVEALGAFRDAFTKLDEGKGACDHKPDAELVYKGVGGYFEAASKALKYAKEADERADKTQNPEKKKYYEYEKAIGECLYSNWAKWTNGTVNWYIGEELKRPDLAEKLSERYTALKDAPHENKEKLITEYKREFHNAYRKAKNILPAVE